MSNGARLTAVIVVVAVAAIGLYFAFMTPSKKDASVQDPLAADGSIAVSSNPGELGEIKPGEAGTGGAAVPPEGAFGTAGTTTATGTVAGGTTASGAGTTSGTIGAVTLGGTAAAGTATSGSTTGGVTPTGTTGTGTTAPAATTVAPAAPAVGTDYVVQKGDTLEGIARAKFGDGQKWRSIVELNPGLKPESLKVGQTIKLPWGASTGGEIAAKPAAPAGTAAPAGSNTYTVQKGDTLIAISRKFFGSDADWKRILEANKAALKGDAGNLQPGMKLTIPAKR